MEKKQSSVEWLIEQIHKDLIHKSMGQIFGQAKAMHKEEIKESYREGRSDQQSNEKFYHRNAEQYYNETFGGKK